MFLKARTRTVATLLYRVGCFFAAGASLLAFSGCSSTAGTTADAGDSPPGRNPGPSMVVTAFDGAYVYFAGDDNKRTIDATATFPLLPLTYETITLNLTLRCPPAAAAAVGGCDFWDRRAFIGLVNGSGDSATVTEIARFMTPYRIGANWTMDVTELRPMLSGLVTLRLFIDTWVGPTSSQGVGWLVDASFDMQGGTPAKEPISVIRLWDETTVDYGDPAKLLGDEVPSRTLTIPSEARSVELRSFITGHGQGNLDNCAEFCAKTHAFTVGGMMFQNSVWRTDCATTAVPGQAGTYQYPRAGWCPGALVAPWTVDVTPAVLGGTETTISYAVETYENTCRPDAPMCRGCALGSSCAYDNGAHTAPFLDLSAVLITYR
jgi:hypothetical protein